MKSIFFLTLLLVQAICVQSQSLELVSDIYPNDGNGVFAFDDVFLAGDTMIFSATKPEIGHELFILINNEVSLLKDISPGSGSGYPNAFHAHHGEIYFFANGANNYEIWKTNGTTDGTKLAISFPDQTFLINLFMIESRRNKFYLTRNRRLYVSDGTQDSTFYSHQEIDIEFINSLAFATLNVDQFEDGIAFVMDRDTTFELYSAIDTTIMLLGTLPVSSQNSFSVLGPYEVDQGLVLAVRDGSGTVGDLYLYNKTNSQIEKYSTTKIVASAINRINDHKILITAENNSNYVTNGTAAGTVKVLSTAAYPATGDKLPFIRIGDKAVFHGGEPTNADAVYVTDGTPTGTKQLKSIAGNSMSNIVAKGQYAFWMNDISLNGKPEVWYANINGITATRLYEHPDAFTHVTDEILPVGATSDKIYFFAKIDPAIGRELYSLDHSLNIPTSITEIHSCPKWDILYDASRNAFSIVSEETTYFQVELYDLAGKKINSFDSNQEWMKLPTIAGMYIASIMTPVGVFSKTLMVSSN